MTTTTYKRRGYARDDVETHYHYYRRLPAVNIKCPLWGAFPDAILAAVAEDHGEDPAAFTAWWRAHEDADTLDEVIYGPNYAGGPASWASEDAFDYARELALDVFPSPVQVWQEGRSGGWLVVHGLPDLDEWDAVALGRWRRFERGVRALVDDYPRSVAWLVCANRYAAEVEQERRIAEAAVRREAEVDAWADLCAAVAR